MFVSSSHSLIRSFRSRCRCVLYCLCVWRCHSGFEYNERSVLGVNAASKWAQELADLNLAAVATPFYKGYKVKYTVFLGYLFSMYGVARFLPTVDGMRRRVTCMRQAFTWNCGFAVFLSAYSRKYHTSQPYSSK